MRNYYQKKLPLLRKAHRPTIAPQHQMRLLRPRWCEEKVKADGLEGVDEVEEVVGVGVELLQLP
jgi:hypothetical protein